MAGSHHFNAGIVLGSSGVVIDTSYYTIKNNATQLLDLILSLWFFQDINQFRKSICTFRLQLNAMLSLVGNKL